MNPMQDDIQQVLNAYKSPPGNERESQIQKALASSKVQTAIATWLDQNGDRINSSPMLHDLNGRVHLLQQTLDSTEDPAKTAVSTKIEAMILSEDYELVDYFRNTPHHLFQSIDLLKTHLDLKTLTRDELLLILERTAENMIAMQRDGLSGDAPYPSLLKAFSAEIEQAFEKTDPKGKLGKVLNTLLQQDSLSSEPYLTDLEQAKKIPAILSTGFIIPLLDQLPKKELAKALTTKNSDGLTILRSLNYKGLSKSQLFHFIFLVSKAQRSFAKAIGSSWTLNLPPIANDYYQTLQTPPDDIDIIKTITLSLKAAGDRNIALAHYINYHRIPIEALRSQVPDKEWMRIAPHLQYVNLSNVKDTQFINKLLENCPNIRQLDISSTKVKELPPLPKCEKLDCSGCTSLQHLPPLPNCRKLNCSGCTSLLQVSDLTNCQMLECSKCTSLPQLPPLPNCQMLECSKCTSLPQLPPLPNCEYLTCKGCTSLLQVSELSKCQKFYCSGCTSLPQVPDLPNCRSLSCTGCTSLQRILQLPNCENLTCKGCTSLQELPPLPNCQRLNCEGCINLQGLPELSWNARVYADGTPTTAFTKLEVHLEKFSNNPKESLLDLGKYLLNSRPFPNIYYFSNGKRSEAIDVGGVRRDFISRLSEHLFKEGESSQGAGKSGFLKLVRGYPVEDEGIDQRECYGTLGKLFALCYLENSYFKTGPLFPVEVYRCIAAAGDPASEEWLLSSFLSFKEAPDSVHSAVRSLIDMNQNVPELDQSDSQFLSYLIDDSGATIADRAYFQDPANREKLRDTLLAEAREDKRFPAISYIAQQMKLSFGEAVWSSICAAGGPALQERIEGTLNREALLKKLKWMPAFPVNAELTAKTQGFLTHWIERADIDKLRLFVRAVTSNNALGPDDLKIEIFDRDKDNIPVAHTCFFTLELSANYPTQEHFNSKLEWLLTEGMAGTGFQVA
jgi:HECT-domain (ubiquitin-transferase)